MINEKKLVSYCHSTASESQYWKTGKYSEILIWKGVQGLYNAADVDGKGIVERELFAADVERIESVDAVVERKQFAEFLHGVEVVFRNITVDEALGLHDDVLHKALFCLLVHLWFHSLHALKCGFVVILGGILACRGSAP